MGDPKHDDELIDEALQETFPASDPPSWAGETASVTGPLAAAPDIIDNEAAHRLELRVGDDVAFLDYKRTPESFTLVHTEVPPVLRGHHLGDLLVRRALAISHEHGLRTVVVCPFARAYLRRHPDLI